MANVTKFPKTPDLVELILELKLGEDEDEPDVGYVLQEQVGSRRWTSEWRVIFKYEGKLWQTFYEIGLTEQQECYPFEYDDEIECTEVEEYEETIVMKKYRAV
jgi:hypothetical protein